jgi:hypothetical protein
MPPTINVAASKNGFVLSAAGTGLSHLTLDGADNAGTPAANAGVVINPAVTPSPSPAPALDHLTAKTFSSNGIQVSGGTLTINQGVAATGNAASGLALLADGSKVTINGGADQISFSNNMSKGINVQNGALTATGTPGTSGAGNLVCNQNVIGISIIEPAGTGPATTVNLTGVVAYKNSLSGVVIGAGTPVKIRSCYLLGNTQMGIDIQTSGPAPTEVDIGTGTDYGHNTLQYASDANLKNGKAGLCNETTSVVNATGNIFGTIDCSAVTSNIYITGTCAPVAASPPPDIASNNGGGVNRGMCGP